MSATYVALLRGVNLGPGRRISMPVLRTVVEELGCADVRTYINSGNVILTTSKTAAVIGAELSGAIERTFGSRVDVVVRSPARLSELVAANPFPDGDASQVTVAFLAGPPGPGAEQRLAAVATVGEPYVVAGHEVWVDYTQGIGTSRLAATFSAVIGVSATVRNLRTLTRLRDLASA